MNINLTMARKLLYIVITGISFSLHSCIRPTRDFLYIKLHVYNSQRSSPLHRPCFHCILIAFLIFRDVEMVIVYYSFMFWKIYKHNPTPRWLRENLYVTLVSTNLDLKLRLLTFEMNVSNLCYATIEKDDQLIWPLKNVTSIDHVARLFIVWPSTLHMLLLF